MSTNQPGKPRVKVPGDDIDATEGHIVRPGRAAKAGRVEEADTEGHGIRVRTIDEAETVNRDIDSTEGHAIRGKGGIEEADTEGHRFKGAVEAAGGDDTEGRVIRGKP